MQRTAETESKLQVRCMLANLIYVIDGHETYRARVEDVSAGAVTLALDAPLQEGQKVSLVSDVLGVVPAEVLHWTGSGVRLGFGTAATRGQDLRTVLARMAQADPVQSAASCAPAPRPPWPGSARR